MATKKKQPKERQPLKWTDAQRQALTLLFEGRKSLDKIALDCAISPRTLDNWLTHPDFAGKLADLREHALEALSARGVAYVRKEQRIIALSQLAEQARSQYEAHELLIESRQVGRDKETGEMLTLDNERFNRDAFDAVRGALDDIAKELGHRKPEKADGDAGAVLRIVIETDESGAPSGHEPWPQYPPVSASPQ